MTELRRRETVWHHKFLLIPRWTRVYHRTKVMVRTPLGAEEKEIVGGPPLTGGAEYTGWRLCWLVGVEKRTVITMYDTGRYCNEWDEYRLLTRN